MFSISSAYFCKDQFSYYGAFACLPLYVAVLLSTCSDIRTWYYNASDSSYTWTHYSKTRMKNFICKLSFEDYNFFTIDDYQLFMPMRGPICLPTYDKLEQDRQELLAEAVNPVHISKNHAKSMLRAIQFWQLFYDTKYPEWTDKVNRTWGVNSSLLNVDEIDEGYWSD